MRKGTLMVFWAGAMAAAMFVAWTGFAQEDITQLKESAFGNLMRPPVPFSHDKHNEKAKIGECQTCHHVYEQGKKSETDSSEDRKCSECHEVKNGNAMPLIMAFHNRCKGCHVERKTGPVMCSECHPR